MKQFKCTFYRPIAIISRTNENGFSDDSDSFFSPRIRKEFHGMIDDQ